MSLVIVEPDDLVRKKLSEFLIRHDKSCRVIKALSEDLQDASVLQLETPTRLGDLLMRLEALEDFSVHGGRLALGVFELDLIQNMLLREGRDPVRLTEKEVLLLQILHEAKARAVPREALLDKVWGYVEGVETHTLETHIYRLRQKIEADPTQPDIIVTDEAGGYFLNV